MKENNIIREKSFNFSLSIIVLYKLLIESKDYVISNQLLKSATSIGANIEEALVGQSRKDFISKMCIASKEARETKYWLNLLDRSKFIEFDFSEYLNQINEITNILTAIVKTSQNSITK